MIDRDSAILTKLAEGYRLEINGVLFWAPFWINWPDPPYFKGAAYKGKGTPAQLSQALSQLLSQQKSKPQTAAEYRKLMRAHGLGVDCSGLAVHVLGLWMSRSGLKLSDSLLIPKAEVMEAKDKPSWRKAGISEKAITDLPNEVSVTEVARLFHKNHRQLINVARLTSPQAAMTIKHVGQAKPGDMIKTTGPEGDHLGVITSVSPTKLRYIESREFLPQSGSVQFQEIKILDPNADLDKQDWADRKIFNPRVGDRLCRLKVLDGRS